MKPYFIWDYDFSEADVRRLLREGSQSEKSWLITRLLEHAHFRDVFQFVNVEEIAHVFSNLKLRPTTQRYWLRALTTWGYHV